MKVVTLVSGGKDSCFSMHMCAANGHEVVALANLLPPDSNTDELDSYMYQTVGHQLVAAYASCTGLPLYRRRIMGHSNSQGLSYSATAGDEVEDLLLLLAFIQQQHPEVQAVASGAIASDYQRLRVESVCARLGLVSLGYLWHQPQDQLLSDMISNGIEAVLVKVAAIGLDPHKHLGKSIRQMQPTLRRLRERFGCNVCGEGGEYETLTLDCPAFTRGRISLDDWQVVMHSPDSIAPVGVLHPTAFHVEPKPGAAAAAGAAAAHVTEVPEDWAPPHTPAAGSSSSSSQSSQDAGWKVQLQVSTSDLHVHIIASAARQEAVTAVPVAAADTAAALGAALSAITAALPAEGVAWSSSCFVHLYLADMCHFGAANEEYCRHLPQVNPPSRACVQVPLPPGCPVLLDVLFARPQQQQDQEGGSVKKITHQVERRVLHVQSISAWAPSCIGPYSQATTCNGLTYMAGQIPLDPASMTLVQHMEPLTAASSSSNSLCSCLAAQVWRTLLSCQAVAVAVRSCVAQAALGLTVYLTQAAATAGGQQLVQAALQAVWADRALLDRQDMPPALVAAAAAAAANQNGSCCEGSAAEELHCTKALARAASDGQAGSDGCGPCDDDDDGCAGDGFVDDYLLPPAVAAPLQPAVVYVVVPALPRGALLEVQPVLQDLQAMRQEAAGNNTNHDESKSADEAVHLQHAAAAAGVHMQVTSEVSGSSKWHRVLIHLTNQHASPATLVQKTATEQAAAAAELLAHVAHGLQQHVSAGSPFSMLRCWYEADAAASAGSRPLVEQLREALQLPAAGTNAVQLVPVAAVSSSILSAGSSGSCWAIIEAYFLI